MFKVAPGTIRYWVSIYKVPSMRDPGHPTRRLYDLTALRSAAECQAAKRSKDAHHG
jgi:hypothetical protein